MQSIILRIPATKEAPNEHPRCQSRGLLYSGSIPPCILQRIESTNRDLPSSLPLPRRVTCPVVPVSRDSPSLLGVYPSVEAVL